MMPTIPARSYGDDGQTGPEFAGVIAVVVAVVSVLLLGAGGFGRTVEAGIEAAMCRITGGSCTTASILARPEEPCEQRVHNVDAKADITVFSVALGGGRTMTEKQLSDHTWSVTVDGSGTAGVKFGEGADGHVDLGKTHGGAGAEADVTLGLTGKQGQTFIFHDKHTADELMTAAEHQPVKDAATSWMGPLQGLGSWAADKIDGHSYNPPPADESFLEGGVSVEAKAEFGEGAATGNASASASAVLGVKTTNKGPDAGSKTVYFKVSADGSLTADAGVKDTPLSVSARGKLGGEGIVGVTYDKEGKPTKFELEAGGEFSLENGLGSEAKGKDLPALLKNMTKVSTDSSSGVGKKGTIKATLDLTNPANLTATADALHALNVPVLLGSGSGDATSTAAAVSGLYDRFSSGDGAHVSLVTYNTDSSSYGAGGSVAEGLKFSLEGGLEFTDSTLNSASYYVPGQGFVTWKERLGA